MTRNRERMIYVKTISMMLNTFSVDHFFSFSVIADVLSSDCYKKEEPLKEFIPTRYVKFVHHELVGEQPRNVHDREPSMVSFKELTRLSHKSKGLGKLV